MLIERTPWDCAALGRDAFELADAGEAALAQVGAPGHYTVKVDPLASKKALHENGFYYCDTQIEPYCPAGRLAPSPHPAAAFERRPQLAPLIAISTLTRASPTSATRPGSPTCTGRARSTG